jgi:hypothetical protein
MLLYHGVCVRARICIHDHAGDSRDSNGSSSSCQWPANQAQTTAGAHTAPRRGLWIALLCAAQRTTHARHSRACGHTQRSRAKQQQWLHPQPSTFACTRSVWLHTRTAVLARHPHAVSQLISAEWQQLLCPPPLPLPQKQQRCVPLSFRQQEEQGASAKDGAHAQHRSRALTQHALCTRTMTKRMRNQVIMACCAAPRRPVRTPLHRQGAAAASERASLPPLIVVRQASAHARAHTHTHTHVCASTEEAAEAFIIHHAQVTQHTVTTDAPRCGNHICRLLRAACACAAGKKAPHHHHHPPHTWVAPRRLPAHRASRGGPHTPLHMHIDRHPHHLESKRHQRLTLGQALTSLHQLHQTSRAHAAARAHTQQSSPAAGQGKGRGTAPVSTATAVPLQTPCTDSNSIDDGGNHTANPAHECCLCTA